MEWIQGFRDFVHAKKLFAPGEKVLLAVSGGRDSMLMSCLFAKANFSFAIAHCNFALRGAASDADEQLVRSWAAVLNVPCFVERFDTEGYANERGISIQMAAREMRYAWFDSLLAEHGYGKLAIAHHKNDSMETVLLNLCRGTGLAGLHGILAKRDRIIRPMLYLSRTEIDRAVSDLDVLYREDASNRSDKYARNRIRLNVIPELKKINPALEETFERNTERFQEVEELMDGIKQRTKEQLLNPADSGFDIDVKQFLALRPLKLMSYFLLSDLGFSETTLNDLVASLDKGVCSGRQFHAPAFVLLVDREKLMIRRKKEGNGAEPVCLSLQDSEIWKGSRLSVSLSVGAPVSDGQDVVSVDGDKLVMPLQVRAWQKGDYFYPFGMRGKKKVSDFFVSIKLPLLEKEKIPIVVNGNGEIVWIAPFRLDNRFRVSEKTQRIFNLAYEKI